MINNNLEKAEQLLKAIAPQLTDSLAKPATLKEIEDFEKKVNKKLPDDFKALYLWHNGFRESENLNLFYGFSFESLDGMLKQIFTPEASCPLKFADEGIDKSCLWNSNWLLFAHDWGGNRLCLDLSPLENGRFGQIIFIDDDYAVGILVAESTEKLVADFVDDLKNGLYFLHEEALEDGVEFLAVAHDIDVDNWNLSKKWDRENWN